jgi:solute carrier family 35 protein C2
MSIAGIAKEVATISSSALLFGDELTPLNITGVAVTICGKSTHHLSGPELGRGSILSLLRVPRVSVGIGLYTHHNYRKRLESDIPLDPHGQPVDDMEPVPGSIALHDGYGRTSVGHAEADTASVRPRCQPAVHYRCTSDA